MMRVVSNKAGGEQGMALAARTKAMNCS